MARMTIHRTGEKPRTTRKGTPCRLDDDDGGEFPPVPASESRLSEDRGHGAQAGDGEDGIQRGQVQTELLLHEQVQEGDDLAERPWR